MIADMKIYYSASEAKAQFSQVLKAVREGDTLIVTYRGDPVAEIRPIRKESETPSPEKLGPLSMKRIRKNFGGVEFSGPPTGRSSRSSRWPIYPVRWNAFLPTGDNGHCLRRHFRADCCCL